MYPPFIFYHKQKRTQLIRLYAVGNQDISSIFYVSRQNKKRTRKCTGRILDISRAPDAIKTIERTSDYFKGAHPDIL